MSLDSPRTAHAFFPERVSNYLKGFSHIFFSRFAQNLMAVPL
jgi:hypothetical protein